LTEVLQVIHGEVVAEEVEEGILEHAAVTVADMISIIYSFWQPGEPYERTKRSRLAQSGFLGLKFMNLLKRTWETGAMPIGAPGWPELALKVASTARVRMVLMANVSTSEYGMMAVVPCDHRLKMNWQPQKQLQLITKKEREDEE
jgi:hypothetical protein